MAIYLFIIVALVYPSPLLIERVQNVLSYSFLLLLLEADPVR